MVGILDLMIREKYKFYIITIIGLLSDFIPHIVGVYFEVCFLWILETLSPSAREKAMRAKAIDAS